MPLEFRSPLLLVTEEAIPPVYRFSLTEKIAIEIADKGHPVYLVCVKGNGDFSHRDIQYHPVEINGWSLFDLKKRAEANIRLILKAVQLCRKEDIRLVYGWWPVLFFTRLTGRKIVSDMPEFIDVMYKSFNKPYSKFVGLCLRLFQRTVARLSEYVITESDISRAIWCSRKIPYEKTIAIPYGVDVEAFINSSRNENFREEYGIGKDEPVIMFHGDIGIDDGVDILIEATRGIGAKTVIIGDGDRKYMQYLKKISSKDVIFTGWIPYREIPGILLNADIYVAPFRSSLYTNSTFPIKQMEAMAAGRPVVMSELHAFSRYVTDKGDCRLVMPGDANNLRSVISELIVNPEERKRLGQNAQRTARKSFDWRIRAGKEASLLIETADKLAKQGK